MAAEPGRVRRESARARGAFEQLGTRGREAPPGRLPRRWRGLRRRRRVGRRPAPLDALQVQIAQHRVDLPKIGSASSSSGPIDRRGVSARASMEGDGDGDDGDSSSIDETRNLLTPRSRRASSVSLRERLPVAVEPFSLRSSSSASGRGGGYWRSIVYCSASGLTPKQW